MEPYKVTIKEWMKLPYTLKVLEMHVDAGSLRGCVFDDFQIIPSNKAFETYIDASTLKDGFSATAIAKVNATYAVGSCANDAEDRLLRFVTNTIFGLMIRAIDTKIECREIGEGKLIMQDRMPIKISADEREGVASSRIMWRGDIFRIDDSYQHRLEVI